MEFLAKIDDKGRVLIPIEIRRKLSLKKHEIVSIRIESGRIIIEPIKKVKKVKARVLDEAFFDAGETTYGQ